MKLEEYSEAFTAIGPYYDTLMSFVNYSSWILYIEKILELNRIKEKRLFDLACGTGVCLELWVKKGFRVIGLDKSLTMLRECKKRFENFKDVYIINGDMIELPVNIKIPIVTCLYDSLNYLLSEKDLARTFRNIYEILDENGIFIFDMNTIHCLRDEWGDNTYYRQDRNINSVWSNSFDRSTSISSLRITLKIKENGNIRTVKEYHRERGYPLSFISRLLSEAGFRASLYRHLTFKPAWENDLRIMGVARK